MSQLCICCVIMCIVTADPSGQLWLTWPNIVQLSSISGCVTFSKIPVLWHRGQSLMVCNDVLIAKLPRLKTEKFPTGVFVLFIFSYWAVHRKIDDGGKNSWCHPFLIFNGSRTPKLLCIVYRVHYTEKKQLEFGVSTQ